MLNLPSPTGNGWSRDDEDNICPTKMLNPSAPEGFMELTSVGVRQLVERTGAVVKEMNFCAVVLVTVKHVKTMRRNIQTVRRVKPRVKRITLMTNLDRTS